MEYTAYAPLLRTLAENDVLCVAVEMPFNLAVLDINAADGITEQYPQITSWYIGGHSLGGSMAASYALENHAELDGLVLLVSYSTADLRESVLDIICIYGSEDHVLNMEKYKANLSNLPQDSVEKVIQGGCHAWFGSYGPQDGDGVPTITAEEQTLTTVEYLVDFFQGQK